MKKTRRPTIAPRRNTRGQRAAKTPAPALALSPTTREDVTRLHLFWHLLWRGTMALLLTHQKKKAYDLLLAKLRRHGLTDSTMSLLASAPEFSRPADGKMTITASVTLGAAPMAYEPDPAALTDEMLAKLRDFARDAKPVRFGRPPNADDVATYYLFDWLQRHPPSGTAQNVKETLEHIHAHFVPTLDTRSLANKIRRGRQEVRRDPARRGPNPLDMWLSALTFLAPRDAPPTS
jgi:hypothetical protein